MGYSRTNIVKLLSQATLAYALYSFTNASMELPDLLSLSNAQNLNLILEVFGVFIFIAFLKNSFLVLKRERTGEEEREKLKCEKVSSPFIPHQRLSLQPRLKPRPGIQPQPFSSQDDIQPIELHRPELFWVFI